MAVVNTNCQKKYLTTDGKSVYLTVQVRDQLIGVEHDIWFDSDGKTVDRPLECYEADEPLQCINYGYRGNRKRQGGAQTNRMITRAYAASTIKYAETAITCAGYDLSDGVDHLLRAGDSARGSGFWNIVMNHKGVDTRVVHYGSGEYVPPHRHNEDEVFHVTGGSADFWTSSDGGDTWAPKIVRAGDVLRVPAMQPHCLVAHWTPHGLTMHVSRNDSTRSVEFIPDATVPWMDLPWLPRMLPIEIGELD